MANTLFDHGTEYHFHKTNFTVNHATMRETKRDSTRPSKLELLQEDYRSRLLREREEKANALFEQRVRTKLLPKKGSVREFFLNRRMLAEEACNATVTLPPLLSNTRYKGKQRSKTRNVEKRSDGEKVESIACFEDNKKQEHLGELEKLRKRNRKSRIGVVFAKEDENRLSPGELSSMYEPKVVDKDVGNGSLYKPRGEKSREVYKHQKRPSDEFERKAQREDEAFASLSATKNKLRTRHGVKSREVYKRGSKPANDEANTDTRTNEDERRNGECLERSFSEVSKSLVKIKELVHRRKTEELILRSKTARLEASESHKEPSTRRTSQSFDEMCRIETELRETISREQKKLLELQERKRRRGGKERGRENRNREKLHRSTETEENLVKKSTMEGHLRRETRLNPRRNTEYERTNEGNAGEKSVSYENKVSEVTRRTQSNCDSALKSRIPKESHSKDTTGVVNHQDLVTCSNCGRGFMKERIAKHEKACRKASARIKKPFDAKRKRAEGTDMEKYLIMGKETSDDSQYKDKKREWRKTHENFIQAIRSARHQEPGPAAPLANPDYIECSYCRRKFKPTVAERHIPRCKETRARPRPPRR